VVQYLCEQGADKEARSRNDMTPLLFASLKGHLPVEQYLCEQGADKEARSDISYTPLLLTTSKGRLAMVQCMCQRLTRRQGKWVEGHHCRPIGTPPCGAVPAE